MKTIYVDSTLGTFFVSLIGSLVFLVCISLFVLILPLVPFIALYDKMMGTNLLKIELYEKDDLS